MTRILIVFFIFGTASLFSQNRLTEDSFYLEQKTLPDNYKSIITDTKWLYLGTWQSGRSKIITPDTIRTTDLMLFDNKTADGTRRYRKIKGKKIVSNTDFATERIVYVDGTTLILETKGKKTFYRKLYRRQP